MKPLKLTLQVKFKLLALIFCLAASVPQLMAQTYTVAGSDTQALGASWSPDRASNDMTQYSGNKYYLLKTVTYSSNSSHEYKITVNHSWNTSYGDKGGSGNATYSVNAGTGFVCYTFDSNSHVPHVVSSLQTVVIAGDDTQALGSSTWNGSATANSMTTTDGITYTMTKSVDYTSGGNKQCKAVVANTDWYGNSSGGNVSYSIPAAGSYTLTYTFNAVTGIVTVDVQSAVPIIPDYYITGDNGLGLGGFKYNPTTTMTYDSDNDVYVYNYNVTTAGTYYFAFADGQGSSWDDFNNNHRIGPNGNVAVNLNGGWTQTQKGTGSYYVTLDAGQVTITLDVTHMRFKVDGTAPVTPVDYYVVGDDTSIFPNGWSTGSETLMTENNGTYTWTASNVHLTMGTNYVYKVHGSDDSWYPSGDNATFNVSANGSYNVLFTFDGTNVNAVPTLVNPDPVYTYDIYIRYTGNEPVGNVYAYSFDTYDVHHLGDWGGTSLASMTSTTINGHTYYHVTITSYDPQAKIIFNENQSSSTQTDNLNLQAGDNYFTYGGGNTVDGPNEAADAAIVYYIVGDIFPNGWNTGDGTALSGTGPYTWSTNGNTIHLDANTDYGYKVLSSEGVYYPSGDNATFSVTTPGTYELSVSFDGTTPTVTATLVQADPRTYSVVGSSALFGGDQDWANALAMTDDNDGTFSWDSQDLNLAAGTYYFKVNDNYGVWYGTDGSDNGDNIAVTVPVNGTYRLHIDFDGSNAPTYTLVRVDVPTIYIEGSEGLGLAWGYAPTTQMDYDATTGLYSYTYTVETGGTYGFLFANGQGTSWDDFNSNYRIGPQSGDQAIAIDNNWVTTQMARTDGGAYQINVAPGTVTIYFDPINMRFMVDATAPTYQYTFYVNASDGTTLPYIYVWDNDQNVYTNAFPGNAMTTTEVLPDGQTWHKWSGTILVDVLNVIVSGGGDNADDTKTKNITNFEPGTYYIIWDPVRPDGEAYNHFELYNDEPSAIGEHQLYIHGGYYHAGENFTYSSSTGSELKYDANTGNYYINNVTLSSNATFCFTQLLGEDWDHVGTRYGNGGPTYTDSPNNTNYLEVDPSMINQNLPLNVWSETYGEYKMFTAGIFNILVNPTQHWVKLIKTDHKNLTPMNVYLQQTDNVEIANIQVPGTTYTTDMFDGYWPLSAYNQEQGDWNPNSDSQHYPVTYIGDTTTVDGKKWWHWQVSASIAEVFFTRTGIRQPYQSETIHRRAGVMWYTWDEVDGQTVMTDHTREYFEAAANALPTNAVVMEGHYYVYFINTLGWDNVYCYAWEDGEGQYSDGYNRLMEKWPGHICELVGIDPVTGYEVWRYDFGTISSIENRPDGILFNDGDTNALSDSKEQTGDFEYINGGVYDYLGLFDGAYTLNNLIRTAAEEVRYTVSNDLLAVYYDADAQTTIHYTDKYGELKSELIYGALYAKDLNQYGEKSFLPDSTYTDYVYDVCASKYTAGGSQIMNKRTTYDQSNWIKLVMSPNYDGRNPVPVAGNERPNLSQYVNHILPAGTLDVFMTDTINPTAHVLAIQMGGPMTYEPNVYVSAHFNDTIVFNYTHNEWLPKDADYQGSYRTRPYVEWNYDDEGNFIYGDVRRERIEEEPRMMFYVAPKPQEIAYLTWVVYDNDNEDRAYRDYNPNQYTPITYPAIYLPDDPGRFYAPKNWDRHERITSALLQKLVNEGKMTPQEMNDLLSQNYLSENQLNNILGGYGQEYGPYTNGFMQYGAVKVNWSLFDEMNSSEMPWWQIFRPGQAYKFKAIIRYARGNGSDNSDDNYCYAPDNGGGTNPSSVMNAPRREAGEEASYPNMYFTSEYKEQGLNNSKFIIFPIEASPAGSNGDAMGNVTSVREIVQDVNVTRTPVSVRYYNLMGVESSKPFDGINIVVTTYSDGTRTSRKILR